ncbi:MAG: prefoldin subunit beta [Thermoplasmata archaeon]
MVASQEELQNEIAKAQQLQQQLQNVLSQKQQMEIKKNDLERALEEIKDLEEDTPMYRNVGENILIKVEDRGKLIEDLEEQVESTEVRLKSFSRQEEKLRNNFQELQKELSAKLSGVQPGPQTGG